MDQTIGLLFIPGRAHRESGSWPPRAAVKRVVEGPGALVQTYVQRHWLRTSCSIECISMFGCSVCVCVFNGSWSIPLVTIWEGMVVVAATVPLAAFTLCSLCMIWIAPLIQSCWWQQEPDKVKSMNIHFPIWKSFSKAVLEFPPLQALLLKVQQQSGP